MSKFYFTYGSDPQFPFCYGYTEIEAPDFPTATKIFRALHPNRPKSNSLNCAFFYTEEQFNTTNIPDMGPCHERISFSRFTELNPEVSADG